MEKVLPEETENSAACRDGPVPSRKVYRDGHVLCVGHVDRLWRLVGELELEPRMLSGIQSSSDVMAGPVSKPTATWQKEGQEDAACPPEVPGPLFLLPSQQHLCHHLPGLLWAV